MTALCISLKSTDPYFNLAAEEYFLKNYNEEIFLLWQSESAIVVGKHQNALAEINHKYVRENQIRVARRLSGGGTVFHDMGNLNYTFMKQVDRVEKINYSDFARVMAGILNELGLNAYTTKSNDILIDGKKISGSAEHVYKSRVLHHGTLLFDSQLGKLKDALKVDLTRFEHKAVQSNRSEVTNISGYLNKPMSIREFSGFILNRVARSYPDARIKELTEEDIRSIETLRKEKYSCWDWIYGYSPRYRYHNEIETGIGKICFTLSVEKGRIKESEWTGNLSGELAGLLSKQLESINHDYEAIKPSLLTISRQLQDEKADPLVLLDKIL